MVSSQHRTGSTGSTGGARLLAALKKDYKDRVNSESDAKQSDAKTRKR